MADPEQNGGGCKMTEATYEGWSHFNGGPWKCTLTIPDGWTQIKSGTTRYGDKCMGFPSKEIKKRRHLLHGKSHNVKGCWELVEKKNLEAAVSEFRVVIREQNGGEACGAK